MLGVYLATVIAMAAKVAPTVDDPRGQAMKVTDGDVVPRRPSIEVEG